MVMLALGQEFPNLSMLIHQKHLEDLLTQIFEFLVQYGLGGAWEYAFLVSSQEMLMLLAQGSHFEKHSLMHF